MLYKFLLKNIVIFKNEFLSEKYYFYSFLKLQIRKQFLYQWFE